MQYCKAKTNILTNSFCLASCPTVIVHIKIFSNRAEQNGFPHGQAVAEEKSCAAAIIFSIPKYIDHLQRKTFAFLKSAHQSQKLQNTNIGLTRTPIFHDGISA